VVEVWKHLAAMETPCEMTAIGVPTEIQEMPLLAGIVRDFRLSAGAA
jgi:hypothetical protein